MKVIVPRLSLITYLFIICCATAAGQSVPKTTPGMDFEYGSYKIENISEDDAPREITFKFTNNGTNPIVITGVKSTCGCIASAYPKEPVAKGQSGEIKISFNPKGMPGKLFRRISVFSNLKEDAPSATLILTGEVERTNDPYYDFKYKMGDLRLRRIKIDYKEIKKSAKKIERIFVVNSGNDIMRLEFENVPDYIKCYTFPERITPGDYADIVFEFDPEKYTGDKELSHEIYINGIGKDIPKFKRTIRITAIID